ncbi:hypothetical protein HMPREF1050_0099 [Haemophilus parahaemolyticus HK385]|uniref:Uncharacterized protein n=1 Tax=Haemophilus parahaemolyticus HK385 TaxID=1095744 RepID=A0ABP2P4J1_HAEPH|nr:hypothetical protein HMPREF1050_0099 [Haemophilus parahaemolyticus HK385]
MGRNLQETGRFAVNFVKSKNSRRFCKKKGVYYERFISNL